MEEPVVLQDSEQGPSNDDSNKYEYVMVFKNTTPPIDKASGIPKPLDGSSQDKDVRQFIERMDARNNLKKSLVEAGIQVEQVEIAIQGDTTIFWKLTTTQERMEQEAERIGLMIALKKAKGGAFSEFEVAKREIFEYEDPDNGHLFRKLHRIGLVESIIESSKEDGGAGSSLTQLVKRGIANKIYPLHEKVEKKWLLKNWASPKNIFKGQNDEVITRLRNYFGEELAIYFAWLGFYTNWLFMAAIVGTLAFILWIVGRVRDNEVGSWAQLIYSVFLALWATFFLEFWKRYSHTLAHDWGMESFEESERPRADYKGIRKKGLYYKGEWIEPPWEKSYRFRKKNILVDTASEVGLGREVKVLTETVSDLVEGGQRKEVEEKLDLEIDTPESEYYPTTFRFGKIGGALPLLTSMVIIVIIATFGVLSFRLFVSRQKGAAGVGSYIGGIINAMVIMFLNGVWRKVAEILTRWENHRTMTSYQDQLVFKIFIFQFVNSYTSLYYIAFWKNSNRLWNSNDADLQDACRPALGEPPASSLNIIGSGCVDELLVQLLTLLMTNIIIGQTREVALPFVMSSIRAKLFARKAHLENEEKKNQPSWQKEANLADYQGTFDEYNEMIVQYGYVTLFAAAFPLAPLLALINNVIEIRTDAIKFVTSTNRPPYRGAQDIGTWYAILEFVGVIAVVTNCALIAFSLSPLVTVFKEREGTSDILEIRYKVLGTVVILEHLLFGIKYLIAMLIPDLPGDVRKDNARQQYIKDQIFKQYEREREKLIKHQ